MAFGDKIKALGRPIATGVPVAFDWPQGIPPFDVVELKRMLRRGWKLEHLGRQPTAQEIREGAEIIATLVAYVDSLPVDQGDAAAVYLTRCLTMEPKGAST